MAVFRIDALDGSVSLVVRAACLTCARQIAVERSPAGEFRMWRDPSQSSVTLIRNPEHHGYLSDGKRGIIKRIEHGKKQG